MTASKGHIDDELFTNKIITDMKVLNYSKIENLHTFLNNSPIFNKFATYNSKYIPTKLKFIHCIGYENIKNCAIYFRSRNKDTISDLYNFLKQDKQEWNPMEGVDKNNVPIIRFHIPKEEIKKIFPDFKELKIEKEKCVAITKKGIECKKNRKYGNFCHIHKEEKEE